MEKNTLTCSTNQNNHDIPHSNGLSQDAQGRWWEMLSPTQILTGQPQNIVIKKSKCHENRKLQHFKRKCRARGLNEEQIGILIQTRHHTISERLSNNPTTKNQNEQSRKRKRDLSAQNLLNNSIKSLSQLSISQETTKKMKNSTSKSMISDGNHTNECSHDKHKFHKLSKYLKMPQKLLLHSLRLHLNNRLKKKKEQHFILSRLQIVDQQFCLNQIGHLYQTYFDLGSQYQIWLVSITETAFHLYIVRY